MARYGMVFDLKRCIGCNACVIGCKQENSLPDGMFFTRTLSEEYRRLPRRQPSCISRHCAINARMLPARRSVPSGATYTRDDGIVMVNADVCIGCGSCAVACPYDQRSQVDKDLLSHGLFGTDELTPFEEDGYKRFVPGTITKCDFCSERVDAGLDPACVVTCPTDARIFGDLDDPDSKASTLIRERDGKQPMPELKTKPKVYYID